MKQLPIIYQAEVPESIIDIAFQELIQIQPKDASMGLEAESNDPNGRNTTVRFAPANHWFTGILRDVAHNANIMCEWNYDIKTHEAIQFAEYGPSQHYAWHTDSFPLVDTPTDRKISVICQMNHPHEYEGGDVQFRFRDEFSSKLKKGTIIAFPSFIEHRVTPVVSGKRYSSVLWVSGPRCY